MMPRDAGDQLKIDCSAGCYEILKAEILEHLYDPVTKQRFEIIPEKKLCLDIAGSSPEMNIRVFNRLNNGNKGKTLKFAISLYNTQCSLLVNGKKTYLFKDKILPELIDNIHAKPGMEHLDRHLAALIDRSTSTDKRASQGPAPAIEMDGSKTEDTSMNEEEEDDPNN